VSSDEIERPEVSERSRAVAAIFDRSAPTYDSVGVPWFTPIAAHLVREIAPQPGERALDLGSGRGAVLLPLAEAVGARGSVVGLDLAPGMVEALRADLAKSGLTSAVVQLGDVTAPDFELASFDLVTASLVLFFLPDPALALRNWRRLLVPGGRIGVSTFGPQDQTWQAADDVFRPYLPQQLLDARTSGLSGPFASDAGVEQLLTGAGFDAVRTLTVDVPVQFTDLEQWRRWSWSHGQRALWEMVPEDRHADVLAEVGRALEPARDENGVITVGQQVRYTFGRRP
jgi:ubiquinone/menaquinone biosynthesis C-methylase UbiE